jgi:hypothetical protein
LLGHLLSHHPGCGAPLPWRLSDLLAAATGSRCIMATMITSAKVDIATRAKGNDLRMAYGNAFWR